MLLRTDVNQCIKLRDWRGLFDKRTRFAFVNKPKGPCIRTFLNQHWQGIHYAGVPCTTCDFGRPGSDPAAQAAGTDAPGSRPDHIPKAAARRGAKWRSIRTHRTCRAEIPCPRRKMCKSS